MLAAFPTRQPIAKIMKEFLIIVTASVVAALICHWLLPKANVPTV